MADHYNPATKYTHTTRKVFDKHVDRMELRRQRDRDDHRADIAALLKRISNIEKGLFKKADPETHDCIDPHCKFCTDTFDTTDGNEELE